MKDFYDAWVLSKAYGFDPDRLAKAIAATFERRRTAIASSLQWGRAQVSAEMRPDVAGGVCDFGLQWGRAQVSAEIGRLQALNFQRPLGGFASVAGRRPSASPCPSWRSRKTQHWQAFLAGERKPGFRRHLAARIA